MKDCVKDCIIALLFSVAVGAAVVATTPRIVNVPVFEGVAHGTPADSGISMEADITDDKAEGGTEADDVSSSVTAGDMMTDPDFLPLDRRVTLRPVYNP